MLQSATAHWESTAVVWHVATTDERRAPSVPSPRLGSPHGPTPDTHRAIRAQCSPPHSKHDERVLS